jgi:DNA-binding NtrC family response regulator
MSRYDWPGNVRRLRNLVHRACITADADLIDEKDLPRLEVNQPEEPDTLNFTQLSLAEVERRIILQRIEQCRGNKSAAAAALGVTARTLRNKVNEYRRLGYAC